MNEDEEEVKDLFCGCSKVERRDDTEEEEEEEEEDEEKAEAEAEEEEEDDEEDEDENKETREESQGGEALNKAARPKRERETKRGSKVIRHKKAKEAKSEQNRETKKKKQRKKSQTGQRGSRDWFITTRTQLLLRLLPITCCLFILLLVLLLFICLKASFKLLKQSKGIVFAQSQELFVPGFRIDQLLSFGTSDVNQTKCSTATFILIQYSW
jgi:archaellum component FlaD/FlaE